METQVDFWSKLWEAGNFVFAGATLVVALMTILVTYLTIRGERIVREMSRGLTYMREQQSKINNTLIVTSDLAISSLPQITFTQQIPNDILNAIGIIDEIFDGEQGNDLWKSIAAKPQAARLAYARAIYRFGRDPTNRYSLIDMGKRRWGQKKETETVLSLLNTAIRAAEGRDNDPVSLQRDILVRKSQVLRQADQFERSLKVSKDLDGLYRDYQDTAARFLAVWCEALTYLQRAMTRDTLASRHADFAKAAEVLSGPFDELFGARVDPAAEPGRGGLAYYRQRWPKVELRSIAYYTAKAEWCTIFTSPDPSQEVERSKVRLKRALDLSLLFYEDGLAQAPTDLQVGCIYRLCVPFLIAVKTALLDPDTRLEEFEATFPNLMKDDYLPQHAEMCLDECTSLIAELQALNRGRLPQFIYTERTERMDALRRFAEDIALIRDAVRNPEALRSFYRDCNGPRLDD